MNPLLLMTLLAAAPLALAQPKTDERASPSPAAAAASAPSTMTEGVVRKIDKDAQKITLKHGEIKSLDMPPMTMVFQVKNPAWLNNYKPGDAVRFSVEKTATGGLLVTEIHTSP